MILLAKNKYQADWVINVDADEFWYCDHGNLKLALPDPRKSNVLFVSALQINAIDYEDDKFTVPEKVSGIVGPMFKCLHTTKFYRHNVMGNHDVKMTPLFKKATTTLDIIIFHFYVRSYKQYERKVVNGVKALMKSPDLRAGNHIIAEYELYKQGKLKDSYDQKRTDGLRKKNYIDGDSRLYDYINNDYKSIQGILSDQYDIYNGKRVSYSAMDSIRIIPTRIKKKINRIRKQKQK
ncbi:MAG: hypothetical protein ACJATL_000983 [Rickettsiales bacterium]|jgi:hypothetical protein